MENLKNFGPNRIDHQIIYNENYNSDEVSKGNSNKINIADLESLRSEILETYQSLNIKSRIPVSPIIHQIYLNFNQPPIINFSKTHQKKEPLHDALGKVPDKWESSPKAWQKYHPSYTYVLWDNEMLGELVSRFYPFYQEMYDHYPYPIQRVDFGRTLILHRYGGLYSDLDLEPRKNLSNLFEGSEDIYLLQDSGRYTNMIMASPINSPFWPKLWQNFENPKIPWWAQIHHFYIQVTTGPLILDKVAKSYHRTIGLLPGRYIQPCTACESRPCTKENAYFIMLDGGSWNKLDSRLIEIMACHWLACLIIIFLIIIAIWILIWLFRREKA